MPTYNPNAEQPAFELLTGTYPFEIIGVEQLTSSGPKTNGLPQRKLKLKFFKDTSFKQPVAEIETSLYDDSYLPPNEQKHAWKFSVFANCCGVDVKPGEPFDVDKSWKGFRGFAECEPQKGMKDPTKQFNNVKRFLKDQPVLPPNRVEDPFAE